MSILKSEDRPCYGVPVSTREKILGCACERFARQGFQKTTVQEICRCAGANIASVNYYFGSKGELYLSVWRQAARLSEELAAPMDDISSPEEWLRQVVRQRIQVILVEGPGSWISHLIHHEMHNQTEFFDEVFQTFLRPMQMRFVKRVAAYLGPRATAFQIQSAVDAVMGFFPMLNFMRHYRKPRLSAKVIEELTQQLQVYILGGLAAVKNHIERDASG